MRGLVFFLLLVLPFCAWVSANPPTGARWVLEGLFMFGVFFTLASVGAGKREN